MNLSLYGGLAPLMAFTVKVKHQLLALSLIFISVFIGKFGKADEGLPQVGGAGGSQAQTGGVVGNPAQTGGVVGNPAQTGGAVVEDPAEIVVKALLCFNDKYVYSSCEETYRLNESGDLHVPPEYTNQYCNGPCLTETHLVLNCIENVLTHFEFYNEATIKDVRGTITAGCGSGSQRGNFNVAEHIQAEKNGAEKVTKPMFFGLVCMVLVQSLLFW